MIPVVILAGGRSRPELQAITGKANRALVEVNGKSLLDHIVDATRSAEDLLGPITVIGDLPDSLRYTRLPDAGDFVANLLAGLQMHIDADTLLISTADLPFVTGASLTGYVHHAVGLANRAGADLVWPIVPVASCYARYPGIRRTALRLREGEFTGGNVALVRPALLLAQSQQIASAYAARKSPLQLARLLGIGTLMRVALSQKIAPDLVTISYLEARVSALLDGACRALPGDWPELATDLDRPADFAAVQSFSERLSQS